MDYMDMIAKLGVGNAHPGGFAGTKRLLAQFPFLPGMKVLEVGCGTGRTACELAHMGCEVTGVDPHPVMLEKARKRAEAEGVRLHLKEGKAEALPASDQGFDRVIVESVTIFADGPAALKEYYRVLKPGGLLLDRELLALRELPQQIADDLRQYYGVERLRSGQEWLGLLAAAGFGNCTVWDRRSMTPQLWEDVVLYPDARQQVDRDLYRFPSLWETARRYDELMNASQAYFEHGVLVAWKPEAPDIS